MKKTVRTATQKLLVKKVTPLNPPVAMHCSNHAGA